MSRFKQFVNDVSGGEGEPDRAAHARAAYADPDSPPPRGGLVRHALPGLVIGGAALLVALGVVGNAVSSAKRRLTRPEEADRPAVATAQEAEVAYCTSDFKTVLERVLHSCGLSTTTDRRGCKPSDIKTFAAISDEDFNALFHPLRERGGVLMFDEGSDELDEEGQKLLEERWFERKGARYFFVVARASKTGTPDQNRALSHRRANSVMFALQRISGETEEELNQRVGLLWLGNEYAQLSQEYCQWPRSRDQAPCDEEPINRSAFVSWVDCRL
jgi:outer membrane protein OmpA-like peptidoglycan-associated protein